MGLVVVHVVVINRFIWVCSKKVGWWLWNFSNNACKM